MDQKKSVKRKDPFQSPRANAKHASHQINGETQQSLHDYLSEFQTNKKK